MPASQHRQRWGFVGPTGTGIARYNKVEIRRGGTYLLLEDDQPPELFDPRPAAGTEMSSARMAELRIGVRDRGTGIDWDGVRFRLDGEPCETEYDPDRNLAFCRPASLPGPLIRI